MKLPAAHRLQGLGMPWPCAGSLPYLSRAPLPLAVTAVLLQKNGAGLHTATSCYWDNTTDGSATLRWENKSMYCVVTVFGLSI